ncbi:MAG: hypothetical protein GQ574_14140 [Crocinitomix sp.]|nr:hypothetical protein [Crocinitomix sp.]
MSHISHDIVIVIPPTEIQVVFDSVIDALVENDFELEEVPFHRILLSKIDIDGDLPAGTWLDPETTGAREIAVNKLRNNIPGGLISVRGIKDKFEELAPYDVGISFSSLDNQTIEYIAIYTRDYIYNPHQSTFEAIIKSIIKRSTIIGIAQGLDAPYDWAGEEIAGIIKAGKLEELHPELVYQSEA